MICMWNTDGTIKHKWKAHHGSSVWGLDYHTECNELVSAEPLAFPNMSETLYFFMVIRNKFYIVELAAMASLYWSL